MAKLPVPTKKVQEYISLCLIKALCAQAGLNVASWKWDDGLDLTVGSAKSGFYGCKKSNVCFYLQVKATYNWKVEGNAINFRLKRAKFDALNGWSTGPQYLIVYLMPKARHHWVCVENENSMFQHAAYFV